ncbi:hypothetical protein SK128_017973 [Halocaridina rubra]|uniref:Alcohol dehydrogenase-like C-terminal domain-containing protein n=1 Tax=Halocaridina rubra TaxID=373956 RepID=A0AAN8X054_HALRR
MVLIGLPKAPLHVENVLSSSVFILQGGMMEFIGLPKAPLHVKNVLSSSVFILQDGMLGGMMVLIGLPKAPPHVENVLSSSVFILQGGMMVLIGLPKAPLHVENVLTDIVFKSLTLKTVHGRRIFHTWKECERLLADGLVNADPVISHQLPMTQQEHAFQLLMSGQACKITVDPQN